jgi:pimeloyl-ACP methyl ester carboxylesterase
MNEASSVYVDKIAIEKLINFKLSQAHHRLTTLYPLDLFRLNRDELESLVVSPEMFSKSSGEEEMISFPSGVTTAYRENNRGYCVCHPVEDAKGTVIFVHGLYEDNRQIYQCLISELNQQGLNVYLFILPFHYERQPAESRFSGEYFLSAALYRSIHALKQAVYDLYSLYRYLRQMSGHQVMLVGFSMGGGVSLLLSALCQALDRVFVINPVVSMARLIWERPLCASIKADLLDSGIAYIQLKTILEGFEPLNLYDKSNPQTRVLLAKGIYDQFNETKDYDLLAERWAIGDVISYKAGHLNILRVPRLATDIADFMLSGAECRRL